MKAGFYQFTPLFGEKEVNLNRVFTSVEDADADLLILPEFFATGYQFIAQSEVTELSEEVPGGQTTDALLKLARQKGMYIVAGLPERDGDNFYNSAVFVGPEGFLGVYRKTHLFFEEKLYFSPGDTGFKVWDTKIGSIGIMVCFDWFFPESMRTLTLMGAQVIAHPSNLILPYCPQAMPTRCLENHVFAVTANRTGVEERKSGQALGFIGQSQVTSPKGEILIKAPEDGEAVLFAEIDPKVARNKSLNPYNDLIKDRRPEMYRLNP